MIKKTNPIILSARVLFAVTCIAALLLGIVNGVTEREFAGGYFITALTAAVSILITHVPEFVSQKDILIMPMGLQVFFSLFTFCAMFLGEILDFYERFVWWDTMLHFISGFMFSVIGFMLFLSINRESGVRSQLNPIMIVIFTICFSIACGAVWEIFEFAGDSLLGMNMQKWQGAVQFEQHASNLSNPGLVNTMKDIISDTLGSALSAAFIYPLAKYGSKYKKAKTSSSELLEEYETALSGLSESISP